MKLHIRMGLLILLVFATATLLSGEDSITKTVSLNASKQFQTIDGFGVNITPAQWRNGNLKPAIDLLVDDLGSTLIRFDCYGKADWLDPSRRDKNGRFPESYLKEIYSRQDFQDAWETFRYLNSKNLEPFFNVSGRIPAALAGQDGQTLTDYQGYAEMVVSMVQWARDHEKLRFRLLSPFNETDLGFPEGPKIPKSAAVKATRAILERLDAAGLKDIKLIVMDDANPSSQYIPEFLRDPGLVSLIACFATHFYGNGGDEDALPWFNGKSSYRESFEKIQASAYRNVPLWLTEYGDLDQTGEVEFGFAWRSTRRVLKLLNDGLAAGLAWDAFDNLHEHDGAWATYGLLKTDRNKWTYAPKRRYYSAKQVYRFVRPGFRRVEIAGPPADKTDVFAIWHAPLKHLLLSAFVSQNGKDFTVVGMNTIESDIVLNLRLKDLAPAAIAKTISYFRTSRNEDCKKIDDLHAEGETVKAIIPENSIFTWTTLK